MFSYQTHGQQLSPFLLLDYAGPYTFDGDGFESAMRMLTDAAFIAARREGVRPGIVEQ
jgi:hypothetical protein